MAIDRAMLVYLSNAENVKGAPNQNFARELMELFTLGVGNYAEGDVEASARAWTGHNADWPDYVYAFYPTRHDTGLKTFFGITKNWNGPEIIDEILLNNAAKQSIAARFITKKLWEFLAHPTPPIAVLDAHRPGFRRRHGSSPTSCGSSSTVPSSTARPRSRAWCARRSSASSPCATTAGSQPTTSASSWRAESTGQQMYQPPNVAGWKPNAYWLNTSAARRPRRLRPVGDVAAPRQRRLRQPLRR